MSVIKWVLKEHVVMTVFTWLMVKIKVALKGAMKAQRGSRDIALLFL